uniref:Uncharacterized protein n=1 Tax=Ixodes ricinus TaxID=34613 RepID=V5IBI9_IXORI
MAAVRLKTAQLCLAPPQMPATLATTAPSRGSQTSSSPPPTTATSESIHLDVEQRDAGMDPVPTTLAAHPRHKRGVKTPDLEQLRFILECFFISFGPECPQLGRNHPSSDPERYATGRHDSATSPNNGGSVSVPVSAVDPETFDHDALLREVLRYFEAGLEAGLDDQPVLVDNQNRTGAVALVRGERRVAAGRTGTSFSGRYSGSSPNAASASKWFRCTSGPAARFPPARPAFAATTRRGCVRTASRSSAAMSGVTSSFPGTRSALACRPSPKTTSTAS